MRTPFFDEYKALLDHIDKCYATTWASEILKNSKMVDEDQWQAIYYDEGVIERIEVYIKNKFPSNQITGFYQTFGALAKELVTKIYHVASEMLDDYNNTILEKEQEIRRLEKQIVKLSDVLLD